MIKTLLKILLLLVSATSLIAQQYNFKIYNHLGDFNLNQVLALYQDRNGFLWVGSGVGLLRYDSESWLRFDVNNNLPSNQVTALAEDDSLRLWVGTDFGLTRVNLNHVANPAIDSLVFFSGSPVLYLSYLDGRLWVSLAGKGLFYWRNGHFAQINNAAIQNSDVLGMDSDDSGNIYLVMDNGSVVVLTTDGREIRSIRPPGNNVSFTYIQRSRNGREFLFGSTAGIFLYQSESRKLTPLYPQRIKTKGPYVFSICQEQDGTIWAASDSGLIRVNGADKKIINKMNGLPNEMVFSILCDRESNIWIGTYTAGLVKLAFRNILGFTEHNGLISNVVNCILEQEDGSKLVGTDAGIFKIKNFVLQRDPRFSRLNDAVIWFIYKDKKGNIWTGGENVLAMWNKRTNKLKFLAPVKKPFVAFDMIQDRKGRYWFGTSVGLYIYKKRKFVFQKDFEEHNISIVMDIAELRDGTLLFGTNNGLARYKENAYSFVQKKDGLPDRSVYAIHEDKTGRLWLGCDLGLIEVLDNGFRLYNERAGLNGTIITQILEDKSGALWLCGDRGLQKFEDGKVGFILTRHDGLIGEEFTTQNSSLIDRQGIFWLGGFGGLTVYDPKAARQEEIQPQIYFTKAMYQEANARPVSFLEKDSVQIPFSHRNLIFDFTGIYFKDENALSFLYQLEGVDKDWQPFKRAGEVRYNNLWPGEYRFKVKAVLEVSGSSSPVAIKKFVIKKPFYFTSWFIALAVILLLLAGFAIIRSRTRRMRKLYKQLEKKIAARTRELAVTKAFLENIIEHVGSAIIAVDTNYKITTWNKRAEQVFGYSKKDMVRASLKLLDEEADPMPFVQILDKVKEAGEIHQLELRKKSRDGRTVELILNATPLYDENGQIYSISLAMEDFSERNRLIDTVINREKAMAGIAALNRLLATLSHYFNNSIMAINGMAQLANLDERYYVKFLRTTEKQVARMQAVLSSLSGLVHKLNLKTRDYVGESDRLFDIEEEIDAFLKSLQK